MSLCVVVSVAGRWCVLLGDGESLCGGECCWEMVSLCVVVSVAGRWCVSLGDGESMCGGECC